MEFVRKNKNDAASLALLSHSLLSHDPKRKVRGYVVTESGPNGKMMYNLKKKRITKYFISLTCVSC